MAATVEPAERKREVRASAERIRAGVTAEVREAAGAAAGAWVLHLPELAQPTRVLAYAATPRELPTAELVAALLAAGHQVAVPVVLAERRMRGRRLPASGLAGLDRGPLGTLQPPAEPDSGGGWLDDPAVVLVPGVAFDPRSGARLGRGGGFYDAYLAERPAALAVGLAMECQLVGDLPVEPHDRPVGVLVTEARLIRFGA